MTGSFTRVQRDKIERMAKNLDAMDSSVDKTNNSYKFSVTDIYDREYYVMIRGYSSGYEVTSFIRGITKGEEEKYSQFSDAFRDLKKRLKSVPQVMKFMGSDY
jgi:hypothetical protein